MKINHINHHIVFYSFFVVLNVFSMVLDIGTWRPAFEWTLGLTFFGFLVLTVPFVLGYLAGKAQTKID